VTVSIWNRRGVNRVSSMAKVTEPGKKSLYKLPIRRVNARSGEKECL
jgi:hypothetical protein